MLVWHFHPGRSIACLRQVVSGAGKRDHASRLRVRNAIAMILHLARLHPPALDHLERSLDTIVELAFTTTAWRVTRAALDHRGVTIEEGTVYGREDLVLRVARTHSDFDSEVRPLASRLIAQPALAPSPDRVPFVPPSHPAVRHVPAAAE
jgi:hypothetical protein